MVYGKRHWAVNILMNIGLDGPTRYYVEKYYIPLAKPQLNSTLVQI